MADDELMPEVEVSVGSYDKAEFDPILWLKNELNHYEKAYDGKPMACMMLIDELLRDSEFNLIGQLAVGAEKLFLLEHRRR